MYYSIYGHPLCSGQFLNISIWCRPINEISWSSPSVNDLDLLFTLRWFRLHVVSEWNSLLNCDTLNMFIHTFYNGPDTLTFTTLLPNSADDKLVIVSLIFPRKQGLTFHANCLQWRQFAWPVKTFFLRKIRKIFQSHLLKILPRVLTC